MKNAKNYLEKVVYVVKSREPGVNVSNDDLLVVLSYEKRIWQRPRGVG